MKIVILDSAPLNSGDLDWQPINSLGEVTIYDNTPVSEIYTRCKDADIVLTNKTPFGQQTIAILPKLKYIGVMATGHNIIDLKAAHERGIFVSNIPAYGTQSVAQFTFALLLELTHQIGAHSQGVKEGQWSRSKTFCYWNSEQHALEGLTMGVLGYGRIGQKVCQIASAFDMKPIVYTKNPALVKPEHEVVDFETLFNASDIVSIHCPLTPATYKLINKDCFGLMKSSSFFINTSRGEIINEEDLADALNHEHIAGAALDVLSSEPPPLTHPLLTAKNCIITPHMA